MTEELLSRWAANAVAQTGLGDVVFAGGVAMNIKLNLVLSELDGLSRLHVGPNPADESNAFGASYAVMHEACRARGLPTETIRPLPHAYLGPSYSTADVRKAILGAGIDGRFLVRERMTHRELAQYLADGRTVGICRGRMEFGARALGNRSILANPSDPGIVRKINAQIKYRDFWMPFTPSVLAERAGDYFENPKGLDLPYMTIGLRSKPLAQRELVAALHPSDLTARPQFVSPHSNPEYYDLIREFEAQTGIGGLLNTSLNLHGHPMVNSPADALFTMCNSDLDVMYFGDIALVRR
jgi:carbamoyltransferase